MVRLALRLLAAAAGALAGPVRVTVEAPGTLVAYTLTEEEVRRLAGPPPPAGLTPLERALCDRLTGEYQPAKRLAAQAGYRMGSHVYQALRSLCDKDLAERGRGNAGYRRKPA
jgi:hypothetical protein